MKPIEELKQRIESKTLHNQMVWVDNNHEIVNYYLDRISLVYNRKLKKFFDPNEALEGILSDFESDNCIYIVYLASKDLPKILPKISSDYMIIFIVSDETPNCIVFDQLSRAANLVYLEEFLKTGKMVKEAKKPKEGQENFPMQYEGHYISRDLLEEALDYFDNNLDYVLNEIKKVKVLGLTGSWDRPFRALLDCLPKKDRKLRSLKWFSGGDVDTCQVLYNIYIKKLKTISDANPEEMSIWSKLITEAIWCEACIVSGLIGDYVTDYLQLVESSLPSDFKVEYFPPVFFSEVESSREWKVEVK